MFIITSAENACESYKNFEECRDSGKNCLYGTFNGGDQPECFEVPVAEECQFDAIHYFLLIRSFNLLNRWIK